MRDVENIIKGIIKDGIQNFIHPDVNLWIEVKKIENKKITCKQVEKIKEQNPDLA